MNRSAVMGGVHGIVRRAFRVRNRSQVSLSCIGASLLGAGLIACGAAPARDTATPQAKSAEATPAKPASQRPAFSEPAEEDAELSAESENCVPRVRGEVPRPSEKRRVLTELLRGQSVYIYLDARRPGVLVPEYLAGTPDLLLQIGYAMARPIPDLKLDAAGVSGTLSFRGQPFFCRIPWPALYGMVGVDNSLGAIWDAEVPAEARRCAERSRT